MHRTNTFLIGFVSAVALAAGPVSAGDPGYFSDDFGGTVLGSAWTASGPTESITVGGGKLSLSRGSATNFPSITSGSDVLPTTGNFSLEIAVQYSSLEAHGDGVLVYNSTGFNAQNPATWDMSMWIWGGYVPPTWQDQLFVQAGSGVTENIFDPSALLAANVYRFEYVDGEVTAWLNGDLVAGPDPSPRPDTIFIGNPFVSGGSADWSDFSVDYINVETIGATNTAPDASGASASIASLWPVNNKMVDVTIGGVTYAYVDDVTITIDSIEIDDASYDAGDAAANGDGTAQLRASRSGNGTGRTYTIHFTATDASGGSDSGSVTVSVAHDQGNGKAKGRGKAAGGQSSSWGEIKRSVQ